MAHEAREVISQSIKKSRGGLFISIRDNARTDRILAALDAAGLVVVPKEPSDMMVVRGDEVLIDELNRHTFALNGGDTPAQKAYRAMIEVALR